MKVFSVIFGLFLSVFLWSCARQSSPMGGPKDEDPPQLLSSLPLQEATETKPSQIELVFDEYIKVENPTKQILITPKIISEEVEFTAQRNRLLIKLNQELEDSTTYVFNFQKSVQDITEGNPANNLKLVFSTGTEIDSLKFKGKVSYVFTRKQRDIVDVLVGLYPLSDTTDLFTASPYYIAQADSAGNFEITNIKEGEYSAYAWHDDNNSLKAEYRSEAYGYLNQPIWINKDIEEVNFNLFSGDLSDLKVNRSSSVGNNYDVILSKFPVEIEIIHPDINKKLFYRILNKNIRLYHTSLKGDSTAVQLNIKDSVGFSIDTTLYAKFETSDRSAEKLEVSATSVKGFVKNIQSRLTFNKPIVYINYDSLYIRYDSASRIPLSSSHISPSDSGLLTEYQINIAIPDSLNFNTFTLYAADSTFMDVEKQWNGSSLEVKFNKIKEETLSDELSGKVETEEFPILVQLLNPSEEVVKENYLTESNEFKFENMEAGEYRLRAIIDRNKNKRWDPGNFYEKRQPEPVYYFYDLETDSYKIMLKGSWTMDGIVIDKREESGIPDKTN